MASWDLAIEQCRTSLSEYDFEKLQTFPTPEKLLSDLKKKETGRSSLLHVRRPIRTMKSFLTFFVVTMSPRTLRSSIFWGLVYLLVDVSGPSGSWTLGMSLTPTDFRRAKTDEQQMERHRGHA